MQYKYQINIDGTVASYRFPYLLAGDGLVLKQDSPFYEHFYRKLLPYVHYVPFKRDLSDLAAQVRWAIDHESEVRQIIRNAQEFTRANLMADHVLCYHVLLLKVRCFEIMFINFFIYYLCDLVFRIGRKSWSAKFECSRLWKWLTFRRRTATAIESLTF